MAPLAPSTKPGAARDAAFERMYRQYVQDVYRYSLALLRNPADAEDVTQTTFMNAYRAFRRGERVEKPQNWLIKIAHNVARSKYARAQRRVQEVPLDEQVAELPVPEDEKPQVQEVLDALAELPFNQRAALVMRELEGRSYAEIAQTLNVSQSAVEALIFRARRSLRVGRTALRGLTIVQLPTSLASFFDGPGSVVVGGGAVVGGGLLLKAAAVVAVSAVAAGVGYKSVEASPGVTAVPAQEQIHPFAVTLREVATPFRPAERGRASAAAERVVGPTHGPRAEASDGDAEAAAANATGSGGSAGAEASSPVQTIATTVASPPVSLPVKVPAAPAVSTAVGSVQVPQVPQVPATATPVVPKLP